MSRDLWHKIHDRFDPESPATDPAMRAERPGSPAQKIISLLDMPFGGSHFLLTGTVGTGKTTELCRIQDARAGRELVVFLDLVRYFSEVVRDNAALQKISSWEVCFLAAVALIRAAKEQANLDIPSKEVAELEKAWRAISGATGTPEAQFDVGTLVKSMTGLGTTAVSTILDGVTATAVTGTIAVTGGILSALKLVLPLGRSQKSLADGAPEMQTLLDRVNAIINHVQRQRRVLLIIDGLDRIRNIEPAVALFVDSQIISQLDCALVVSGPFALRHHTAFSAVRGFKPFVLVNEPVLDKNEPDKPGPGVSFFCDVFARRSVDLNAAGLIERDLLEKLAYRSGGRARDFVRLVRELAIVAWQADAKQVTQQMVDEVLDSLRRLRETGLNKGHIELLEKIALDPLHQLPKDGLAQELLLCEALLPYPNESEWYYPHPLLMMHLVKPRAPGSTGSSSL